MTILPLYFRIMITILIILGYIVMWILSAILFHSLEDSMYQSFLGLIWPITLPFYAVYLIVENLTDRLWKH